MTDTHHTAGDTRDLPCEQRYHNNRQFQQERFQVSDAVADVRQVKAIVAQLQMLSMDRLLKKRRVLQPASVPVRTRNR